MKKVIKGYSVRFHISSGTEITTCNINEHTGLLILNKKPKNHYPNIEDLNINYLDSISETDLKNKKFYRYPKLDLPRNKVEILKDKYNISIKRKKEDADLCIFNPDELTNHLNTTWNYYITKDEMLDVMESNECYFDSDQYNLALTALSKIDDDSYFTVNIYAGWQWRSGSQAKHPSNIVSVVEASIPTGINSFYTMNLTACDRYNEMLNDKKLICDSALLDKVSKHSVTITEEDYYNLSDMINSKEDANITMALEVMSNCNIQESYDKIACLLYYNIEWIKHVSNWNTINIKSLRKTMSKYCDVYTAIGQTHYYNNFLKRLEEDNNLTRFAVDITRNLLYKNVMSSQFGDNSIFEFKLSDIRLKPESILNIKKSEVSNDCELLEILLNDK